MRYHFYSNNNARSNLMQEISIHGLFIMHLNVATDDLYQKITRKLTLRGQAKGGAS